MEGRSTGDGGPSTGLDLFIMALTTQRMAVYGSPFQGVDKFSDIISRQTTTETSKNPTKQNHRVIIIWED